MKDDEDLLVRLRQADPYPRQPRYDDAVVESRISAIIRGADGRAGVSHDGLAETACRLSRSRRLAPVLASVAVVVAVVLGVLVAVRHSSAPLRPTAQGRRSSHRNAQPTPSGRPYVVPVAPAGFTDNEFRMASTEGGEARGQVPLLRATCTPRQITATAATRRTAGGVLGVIRFVGAVIDHNATVAERCSLPFADGPSALIGANGQRLSVPLSRGDTTNPPSNSRPDLDLNGGDAVWGFAWLGSYCGAPASAIDIPLQNSTRGSLRVSLHGPQPSCTPTARESRLIDGIAGAPGEPVQPPRPEYATLRLTGTITPGTTTDQLAPITATLRTTGTGPVTLDPCPSYFGRYDATARTGAFSNPIASGHLACDTRAIVIRPGHPLHWTIPVASILQTPGTAAIPGSTVHVELGVAGVPPIELSTTVHR